MNDVLKVLIIIAMHGKGESIIKECEPFLNYSHITFGRGTASNEVLNIFGLDSSEKEIISCTVLEENVGKIYKILTDKFRFWQNGVGLAFTIPIVSVGGKTSLELLSGKTSK